MRLSNAKSFCRLLLRKEVLKALVPLVFSFIIFIAFAVSVIWLGGRILFKGFSHPSWAMSVSIILFLAVLQVTEKFFGQEKIPKFIKYLLVFETYLIIFFVFLSCMTVGLVFLTKNSNQYVFLLIALTSAWLAFYGLKRLFAKFPQIVRLFDRISQ